MIYLVREKINISDGLIVPDDEDLHYLTKVRRIRDKEKVTFAASGIVFETETEISGKTVLFKIINKHCELPDKPKLFAAIASADVSAVEESLRNGVEAGSDAFFIFRSDYSNIDISLFEKKLPRLKGIVASAASQSRRSFLPGIHFSTKENLAEMNCEHIVLHPYSSVNLNSYDCKNNKDKMVWIGAEGGFSEKETLFFEEKNFALFSIKTPILRMENAVTFAVAHIRNKINCSSAGD